MVWNMVILDREAAHVLAISTADTRLPSRPVPFATNSASPDPFARVIRPPPHTHRPKSRAHNCRRARKTTNPPPSPRLPASSFCTHHGALQPLLSRTRRSLLRRSRPAQPARSRRRRRLDRRHRPPRLQLGPSPERGRGQCSGNACAPSDAAPQLARRRDERHRRHQRQQRIATRRGQGLLQLLPSLTWPSSSTRRCDSRFTRPSSLRGLEPGDYSRVTVNVQLLGPCGLEATPPASSGARPVCPEQRHGHHLHHPDSGQRRWQLAEPASTPM